MTVHELKTWPEFFEPVARLEKPFEIRVNDRDYQVNDVLYLREFEPDSAKYSGRWVARRVSYLMIGPAFGLKHGWACMGLGHTDWLPGSSINDNSGVPNG